MKFVIGLALFALASVEAGIISPFYLAPGNSLIYPVEYRKFIPYTKPYVSAYTTQVFGGFPHYTFPVVQPLVHEASAVAASSPVYFVPAVRGPSTVVAKADAASGAGAVGSSVVARSGEAVPLSVVANAGPDAAYSSAVVHPGKTLSPVSAGAQASIIGGH